MIYAFKEGFRVNGDPQAVGESLEAIRIEHGGHLRPEHVLGSAMKRRSPLRQYFEWDDTQAAHQYRLSQAAYLIRSVVVAPSGEDETFEPVRAFVCIGGTDDQPKAFTHICQAMRDERQRGQVIQRARKELQDWRRRYADLESFAEIFTAIDAAAVA